ncbi:MAG: carboxypeptidase-like regulatory domain-containing protein [Bacteroidales bacterium]|nr:carboxypeptidase-like regulatory domain-containing protein [Bacteroidales bacterium]
MIRISLAILTGLLFSVSAVSQNFLQGKVTNLNNEVLPGANVYWYGTETGVVTNDVGEFRIKRPESDEKRLIVSFVGFSPDTLNDFRL